VIKTHAGLVTTAIGLSALMTAGCGSSTLNGQPKGTAANAPEQQKQFCQILQQGFSELERLGPVYAVANPLKKDALAKQLSQVEQNTFDRMYQVIGPAGQFSGWRGRVNWDKPDARGLIQVQVDGVCGMPHGFCTLATGYSGYVEATGNTGVVLNSPLGKALAEVDPLTQAVVSGRFVWARNVGLNGKLYDSERHPIRICADHHFYEMIPMVTCMPVLDVGNPGINLLVQFTAIAAAR
jgi:hypothetical protein